MQKEIQQTSQKQYQTFRDLKEAFVPNFKNLNQEVQKQICQILTIFLQKRDKKIIQAISRTGVLEQSPILRAHIWKLQLQTLTLDISTWGTTIKQNYRFYRNLVKKLFPKSIDLESQFCLEEKSQKFDEQLWEQITLDTKRTHTVLSFFKTEVLSQKMYTKRATKHSDILGRILYIWGKVNPRIRYVQGMNQMLAPLYYLEFQQDENPHCQSEVFFMFSAIMTFSIDMHMKQLDQNEFGIMGRMKTLNRYLKTADYQIWLKLENESIMPHHYSFRWLALLLAQQFELDETLRIWDVLFSFDGQKRFLFLYCLCISIIKIRKQDILDNDLVGILPKLQKLKDIDEDQLLDLSVKLYDKYSKISLQKLSQRFQSERNSPTKYLYNQNQKQQTQKLWDYGSLLKKSTNYLASKLSWN